jgi:hypothetical protein
MSIQYRFSSDFTGKAMLNENNAAFIPTLNGIRAMMAMQTSVKSY